MKIAKGVTETELGIVTAGGVLLVVGSIWWLKGLAVAALVLGAVMLIAAWSCVD